MPIGDGAAAACLLSRVHFILTMSFCHKQTVTSSETTYGGGVAVMHCESTLLQSALSIVYGKEHDVVQPGLLYRHEGKKQH